MKRCIKISNGKRSKNLRFISILKKRITEKETKIELLKSEIQVYKNKIKESAMGNGKDN